jgi:hypothetical protein
MLDCLRRSEETGVKSGGPPELLHDFLAFVDNSIDCVAGLPFRRLLDQREHFFEAVDLTFGLAFVFLERCLQLLGLRGFRHFRKSGQDLLLGVVDVFEGLVKEVIERLVIFCRGISGALPLR